MINSTSKPVAAVTKMVNEDYDPYVITTRTIQEPPKTLSGIFRRLGPGFVLSAAVVGSGELIATTNLGARAGFITFWIIIVSCLV